MKVLGFTGGIGSGKSMVLSVLEKRFNAKIIMADELGHRAMEKGCPTYFQMIDNFGTDILDKNGNIDRAELATILFSSEEMLEKQNNIVHPFVHEKIKDFIEQCQKENIQIAAIESAILYEAGCEKYCDEVWLVTAPYKVRIDRLEKYRGYTREKAYEFISRQKNDEEYMKLCDRVIVNDGDIENIYKQLEKYIEQKRLL